jgi:hypothetical protein
MARGLETADGFRSSLTRSELRDILIGDGLKEPRPMSKPRKKKRPPNRVPALPGLEQSKAAVINTLTSKERSAQLRSRYNLEFEYCSKAAHGVKASIRQLHL